MPPRTLRVAILAACFAGAACFTGLGDACLAQMPAIAPLPGTGSLGQPADPDHFVFVVAGDNRPRHAGDPPTDTIQQIAAAVQVLQPAFLITLGDTIFGKDPSSRSVIAGEYGAFFTVIHKAGVPVVNAPGNHEMDDGCDVPNATMQQWYGEIAGQPYGAFTYGNSRFIIVNTEEIAPPGVRSPTAAPAGKHEGAGGKDKDDACGDKDPGYVSAAQIAALRQDLDADKGKAHVFIFMHHPIEPEKKSSGLEKASAKALKKLFEGYSNVSFVLGAHEHLFFNPQDPANVATIPSRKDPGGKPYYLVSGGAGAKLAKDAAGAFFHYLVFEVSKDRVDVTLKKLPPPAAAHPAP